MKNLTKRLLALVLACVMVLGLAPVALASNQVHVAFEQVSNDDAENFATPVSREKETVSEAALYNAADTVRVSIFLEDEPTIALYADDVAEGTLATNSSAVTYRANLQLTQQAVAEQISDEILGGDTLDVVWNLTLATNAISANVEYGQIDAIRELPGVASVEIETRYEPMVVSSDPYDPNMSTSSDMIGSGTAWADGYTGVGSKIAVIDTGTDTNHQSFDAAAFQYAVTQSGKDVDLMDVEDIASVLAQLNIYQDTLDQAGNATAATPTAEQLYLNAKLPFAYNYIDSDYDITHDNDTQGEHGSHVAGIATANRYISDGNGGFSDALDTAHMQGVAPDAQLITMKVFGKGGGAYDSDYMAAIEDAIVLGADSINLSLGSSNPGMSTSANYQHVMDSLTEAGAVVCISSGNSGTWQQNAAYRYLFDDDVSMQTNGSPGSYTNSLTVASVDNTGITDSFLDFGEITNVAFSETSGYSNTPIATLDTTGEGTEYDFVLFDNTGADESGNSLLTDYTDVVAGKVVMVWRGTSSFNQKHDAVGAAGGAACIVMNNQAGTINMDLSSSTSTIPCISILQSDANAIMANAEPVYAADTETVLYYTGKVTISSAVKSIQSDPEYWTLSSFSSWGIPGSLEMKPEITAPGGNIYSVNGAVADGKSYENMSGTSMASPQVAGMTAVLAQYIRENDLCSKTGLTQRQLAQSLLMSTAVPMDEAASGNYYSILAQGAGVANISNAINAHSYIKMADDANSGAADGKVKVELGDDPTKTGVYTVTFTLNNLKNKDAEYQFSLDAFTQDIRIWYDQGLLKTQTISVPTLVEWTVDGQVLNAESTRALPDLNGDGMSDWFDAVCILDYTTGNEADIDDAADLDADGTITTYDAYLYLAELNRGSATLPANGSITVTATITLPDEGREILDLCANGAYLEAYLFAKEVSSVEGEEGTVHSIPVLGFYGNWSDPTMFDPITFGDYWYGNFNSHHLPYLVSYHNCMTNYVSVKFAQFGEFQYMGNPMDDDEEYLIERNAFNTNSTIANYYYTSIRNAGGAIWQVTDAKTGEVYTRTELGSRNCAYYNSNQQTWANPVSSIKLDWSGTDLDGNKLPEGTEVNVSLVFATEYYASEDGTYDWDTLTNGVLGEGAYLTNYFVIDDIAPEVSDMVYDADAKTLTITAGDNRYLAYIGLYKRGGGKIGSQIPNQELDEIGTTRDYTFNVSSLEEGAELFVQLVDYAGTSVNYRLVLGGSSEKVTPTSVTVSPTALDLTKGTSGTLYTTCEPWMADSRVTWSSADESIATVDENGMVTGVGVGTTTITAASVLDPTVTGSCEVTVKTFNITLTGALQDKDGNPLLFSWNMETEDSWHSYADLSTNINAITLDTAHENGPMYQMDTSGYLYQVNPTTGETLEKSKTPIGLGYPVDDMAYAPIASETLEQDVLFGVYSSYFLFSAPGMDNGFVDGWELSGYLNSNTHASRFTAIAWAGYTTNEAGNTVDVFYCLDNAGYIWAISPDLTTKNAGLNIFPTNLALKYPGYGDTLYCSMVMGDDGNMYLSYFDGNTNQIYVLEEEAISTSAGTSYRYNAALLGDVGDEIWPAGLLTVHANASTDTAATALELASTITVTAQEDAISLPKATVTPSGSLNTVTITDDSLKEHSNVLFDDNTDTLKLVSDTTTHNGLVTVEYDPSVVTLSQTSANTNAYSWNKEEGLITFAYANAKDIPSGTALANLTFAFAETGKTTVKITTLQENNNVYADGAKVRTITLVNPLKTEAPTYPVKDNTPPVTYPSAKFIDLDLNAWYRPYTDKMIEDGIMQGVSANTFDPNGKLTRSALVTMLWRMSGSPSVKYNLTFTDVPDGMYYTEAVRWAASNGIVTGLSDTAFGPDQNITREQLAAILFRLAESKGMDVSNAGNVVPDFADRKQISSWAGEAVCWAYTRGIINGKGANMLDPTGTATRVEAAAMMVRFSNLSTGDTQ